MEEGSSLITSTTRSEPSVEDDHPEERFHLETSARTEHSLMSTYRFMGDDVERLMRSVLSRQSLEDMAALEEGARYAKHALAIYTWVLYLYVHPVSGLAKLLWTGRCSPCDSCHDDEAVPLQNDAANLSSSLEPPGLHAHIPGSRLLGDNAWQMHKNALLITAGLQEADLVYAQLQSGFSENPYCILLDHAWKSVVVSVRGTFSLEDCVTDVLIEPESLEPLGEEFGFDAKGQYCHGGVLACVRNVYRDLKRHRLLESLLLGDSALYPNYKLRLVGHSLGAATCTILSYMLRPKFPNLRCVNYSPPGCSLTWELATKCQDWCTSFVLDADLVPRLSLDSMEHLRDEILELIARIKVPKIEVARRVVIEGGSINLDDLLHEEDSIPDTEYKQQLERFRAIQMERRSSRGMRRSVKLYPPGKMIHLVKTGERKSCIHGMAKCLTCCTTNIGFEYTPIWVKNDDFPEIVVTPTMGSDHFPNRIQAMLERVAEDFGLDVH